MTLLRSNKKYCYGFVITRLQASEKKTLLDSSILVSQIGHILGLRFSQHRSQRHWWKQGKLIIMEGFWLHSQQVSVSPSKLNGAFLITVFNLLIHFSVFSEEFPTPIYSTFSSKIQNWIIYYNKNLIDPKICVYKVARMQSSVNFMIHITG